MASVWDQFSDPVEDWDSVSTPAEQPKSGGPTSGRKYVTQSERQDNARNKMYRDSMAFATGQAKAAAGTLAAIPEAALSLGTGAALMPVAGYAGAVAAPFVGADRAAYVVNWVNSPYEPKTAEGQALVSGIAAPFQWMGTIADKAGGAVAEKTGMPSLGAGTNAAIQGIPALLLRRSGGNRVSDRAGAVAKQGTPETSVKAPAQAVRRGGLEAVPEKPPTIDELKSAKDAAYKAAEETGVVVSRAAVNRLKVELVNDLKSERINSKLHPKASAALEEILKSKGQLGLSDIETLRKIARDAADSIDKADARLGVKMIERIDNFEETLGPRDVVSGSAESATAFKEARALNTRLAKARTIQKLFDDAELQAGANFTQSGMENALRQQFKALAKNDRKMRGFTPEERAAIKKVALGAPFENAMRLIGKFAPTGGVSGPLGVILGTAGFGWIPAAGMAGRVAATKMTMRNANRASELVRSGPETRKAAAMATAETQ